MVTSMKFFKSTVIILSVIVTLGCELGHPDFDETRRAALNGDTEAQVELGYLYHDGKGVAQSYLKAMEWWQKAAEQGNAFAQFNFAVTMLTAPDPNINRDYDLAIKWYLAAAEQGHPYAQFNLANECYNRERDLIKAYAWFFVAAAYSEGDTIAAKRRDDVARELESTGQMWEGQALATELLEKYGGRRLEVKRR